MGAAVREGCATFTPPAQMRNVGCHRFLRATRDKAGAGHDNNGSKLYKIDMTSQIVMSKLDAIDGSDAGSHSLVEQL
jgi:hypothetical protein